MDTVEKQLQDLCNNAAVDMRQEWEALATEILGQPPNPKGSKQSRKAYVRMLNIFAGFRSRSQRDAYRSLVYQIALICTRRQISMSDLQIDLCQKYKYSPSHMRHVLTGRRSMSVEGLNLLAEHLPELQDMPEFQACVATTKRADAFHYKGNLGGTRQVLIPESERREILGPVETTVTVEAAPKAAASREGATMASRWKLHGHRAQADDVVAKKVEETMPQPETIETEVIGSEEPKLVLALDTVKLLRRTDLKVRDERSALIAALTADGVSGEQILMLIHELLDD